MKLIDNDKAEDIEQSLRDNFGQAYQYSSEPSDPVEVVGFDMKALLKSLPISKVQEIIQKHEVGEIFEVATDGWNDSFLKPPTELCDPRELDITHGFWTSETFDWVVYFSDLEVLNIGGWLLDEVKHAIPEWQSLRWPLK